MAKITLLLSILALALLIPTQSITPTVNSTKGVEDILTVPLMLVIVKTPGKCTDYGRGRIELSSTGEHQDYVLGDILREKYAGFLLDTIDQEKDVFALATYNRCHWSSLQNVCRALFQEMWEDDLTTDNLSMLTPPGSNKDYFGDGVKGLHNSLPKGFWPVAIRTDNVETVLMDNLNSTCPKLNAFIENTARHEMLAKLRDDDSLTQKFEELLSRLASEGVLSKLKTVLKFSHLELIFEEIQHRNLDSQLEESTYLQLQDFYWMFMYAKYASNPKVRNSLVAPLVELITSKLNQTSQNINDPRHGRDRLVLLSVSNKVLTALYSLIFSYSHECFYKHILAGSQRLNQCPGKISPTSNLILEAIQILDDKRIISYIDGDRYDLCRGSAGQPCPLSPFLEGLSNSTQSTGAVTCKHEEIFFLTSQYDIIMAKIVAGLMIVFLYFLICWVRYWWKWKEIVPPGSNKSDNTTDRSARDGDSDFIELNRHQRIPDSDSGREWKVDIDPI